MAKVTLAQLKRAIRAANEEGLTVYAIDMERGILFTDPATVGAAYSGDGEFAPEVNPIELVVYD